MKATCHRVLTPQAAERIFVRPGDRIETGDLGWALPSVPPQPPGRVLLEASAADWTILWVAVFPAEALVQPPELVEPFHGYPQPNCRPARSSSNSRDA